MFMRIVEEEHGTTLQAWLLVRGRWCCASDRGSVAVRTERRKSSICKAMLALEIYELVSSGRMLPIAWRQAVNQFAIPFGDRFTCAIS